MVVRLIFYFIFLSNEEEWSVIRENFQQEINRVEIVTRYLPNLDAASKEFIDYLARSRNDDGIIPDLVFKMHEWALESE